LTVLNPDGVSVRGCSIIYAPEGQAGEYAPLAANPYRGCGHGCAYCYVPNVLRMPRPEFDAGAHPRPDFLPKLAKDARKYQALGVSAQVMLSFTTDPYNPFDTTLTRPTLEVLRDHGLGFCTLTKGGLRATVDHDLFRRDRDAFACTLTSLDDRFSKKWERNAALPQERIAALKFFHERGIFTWVSLEPTSSPTYRTAISTRCACSNIFEGAMTEARRPIGRVDAQEMVLALYLGNAATNRQWFEQMVKVTPQKKSRQTGEMKPGISGWGRAYHALPSRPIYLSTDKLLSVGVTRTAIQAAGRRSAGIVPDRRSARCGRGPRNSAAAVAPAARLLRNQNFGLIASDPCG
jgi:hypothetical protein